MEPFHHNWIYPTVEQVSKQLMWKLSDEAEQRIITESSEWTLPLLKERALASVVELGERLGTNPFVALSGGVDSQAACLALLSVGIKFTAGIMMFENNFNAPDVLSAVQFCKINRIKFVIVKHDILKFLNNSLGEYVLKYECPSPQITSHLWFFEVLKDKYKATSIIAGGNSPNRWDDDWSFMSTRSQSSWMTFAKMHNFPIFGNFLAYSLDIALPLMMTNPGFAGEVLDKDEAYSNRVNGMRLAGYNVTPQAQKYTGFESIKAHFEKLTNDGWAFEKAFRYKYTRIVPEYSSALQIGSEASKALHAALEKITAL